MNLFALLKGAALGLAILTIFACGGGGDKPFGPAYQVPLHYVNDTNTIINMNRTDNTVGVLLAPHAEDSTRTAQVLLDDGFNATIGFVAKDRNLTPLKTNTITLTKHQINTLATLDVKWDGTVLALTPQMKPK